MEGQGPGDGMVASGEGEAGPQARAETVGVVSLVQRTLDVFLARWYVFMVLAVPSTLSGLLFWHFTTVPTTRYGESLENSVAFLVIMPVLYPATVLGSLAICAAADDLQSGGRAGIGTALARGSRRFVLGCFGLTGLLVAFVVLIPGVGLALFWVAGELPSDDQITSLVPPLLAVFWWFVWWQGAALIAIGRRAGPDQSRRPPRLAGDLRTAAAFLLFALLTVPSVIGAVWMSSLPTAGLPLAGAFILNVAVTPLIPIALTIARRDVAHGAGRWDRRLPVTYLAIVLIASAVVVAPAVASAAATAAEMFATVPPAERGLIFAGTDANPFDACRPLHRRRDFPAYQTIYFGGYYRRPLLPGETATLRTYGNDTLLGMEPISTTEQAFRNRSLREQRADCYAGVEFTSPGLEPGEEYRYRCTVTAGSETLAEGGFTVRSR